MPKVKVGVDTRETGADLAKLRDNFDKVSDAITKAFIPVTKYTDEAAGSIAFLATRYIGAAAAIEGARRSFLSYANLDVSMRRMALSAGVNLDQVKRLIPGFNQLSAEGGEAIEDLIKGFNTLRERGHLTWQQTQQLFPDIVKGAYAAGMTVNQMSEAFSTVIFNLKITGSEAGKAMDTLFYGINRANLNLGNMANSLPELTSLMQDWGEVGSGSLNRMVGLLSVLKDATGSDAEAAMAMVRILQSIGDPSISRAVGRTTEGMRREMRAYVEEGHSAIEVWIYFYEQAKARGMDVYALNRFVRIGIEALSRDWVRVVRLTEEAEKATGEYDKSVRSLKESPMASVNRLTAAFRELGLTVGKALDISGVTADLKRFAALLTWVTSMLEIREAKKTGEWGTVPGVKEQLELKRNRAYMAWNYGEAEAKRWERGLYKPGPLQFDIPKPPPGAAPTELDKRVEAVREELLKETQTKEFYVKKGTPRARELGKQLAELRKQQADQDAKLEKEQKEKIETEQRALDEQYAREHGMQMPQEAQKGVGGGFYIPRGQQGIFGAPPRGYIEQRTPLYNEPVPVLPKEFEEIEGGAQKMSAREAIAQKKFATSGFSGDFFRRLFGQKSYTPREQEQVQAAREAGSVAGAQLQEQRVQSSKLEQILDVLRKAFPTLAPYGGVADVGAGGGAAGYPHGQGRRGILEGRGPGETTARTGIEGGRGGPRINYFEGRPLPGPEGLAQVKTPYGNITVNKEAAGDYEGFYGELGKMGAPIGKLGSYNKRPKTGGRGWSMHAYGGATDIDDQRYLSPQMRQWIAEHPNEWRDLLRRYNMSWGGDWQTYYDPGHVEWGGPRAYANVAPEYGRRGAVAAAPTGAGGPGPVGSSREQAFATIRDIAAQEGSPDPDTTAAIAMQESGWLSNRGVYAESGYTNPFGQKTKSGANARYNSLREGVRAHIRRWGSYYGKNVSDTLNNMVRGNYNRSDPNWRAKIAAIRSNMQRAVAQLSPVSPAGAAEATQQAQRNLPSDLLQSYKSAYAPEGQFAYEPTTTDVGAQVTGLPSSGTMKHETELARRAAGSDLGDYPQSVVDLMKLIGGDTSPAARRALAAQFGYVGPNRSYDRNIFLRNKLMQQLALKGGNLPGGTPLPRARPEIPEPQMTNQELVGGVDYDASQWTPPKDTKSTHTVVYKTERDPGQYQFMRRSLEHDVRNFALEANRSRYSDPWNVG